MHWSAAAALLISATYTNVSMSITDHSDIELSHNDSSSDACLRFSDIIGAHAEDALHIVIMNDNVKPAGSRSLPCLSLELRRCRATLVLRTVTKARVARPSIHPNSCLYTSRSAIVSSYAHGSYGTMHLHHMFVVGHSLQPAAVTSMLFSLGQETSCLVLAHDCTLHSRVC